MRWVLMAAALAATPAAALDVRSNDREFRAKVECGRESREVRVRSDTSYNARKDVEFQYRDCRVQWMIEVPRQRRD